MFDFTVQDVKTAMSQQLHGTSLKKIQDVNGLIERAARDMSRQVDIEDLTRVMPLQTIVGDQVTKYVLPDDVSGNRIIDVRPQALREYLQEVPTHQYSYRFRQLQGFRDRASFSINTENGYRTLQFQNPAITEGAIIDGFEDAPSE